jgi:hypothetical protein
MKEYPPRQCAFCGDTFVPHNGKQIYDVRDCQVRADRQKRWEQRQAEKAEREAAKALVEAQ